MTNQPLGSLTILGSGTSTGVPVVGKAYSPSYLANPKNIRTRPAALLEGPQGKVLIDAGADCREQLLREGVTDLEAVLITHTHADHIMGMDDLRPICALRHKVLPVYARPEHQEDIRRVFHYAFREFPPGISVPRFDLMDVPPQLNLAGLEIRTFWVEHGPTWVMGIRVGDLAYVTDVSRIPDEALPLLENLDTLILDAVRREPHPNHFHLSKALDVIAEIRPKTAWLTHLSDDYDHDVEEKTLPNGVFLAYDGLKLSISRPKDGHS